MSQWIGEPLVDEDRVHIAGMLHIDRADYDLPPEEFVSRLQEQIDGLARDMRTEALKSYVQPSAA